MLVTYKRCNSEFTEDLRFPVYAGDDGSIVIFNDDKKLWEQLNQTHDTTNGYWVVSIPKVRSVKSHEKSRLERDVHRLVCIAWKGEPPSPKHRVDHKNGDRNDNRANNLDWISARDNASKANKHEKEFPADFNRIIIDCARLRSGHEILDSVSISKTDGTSVPARQLAGSSRGRPPTRLSSLLEALYPRPTAGETQEKGKRAIDNTAVVVVSDNKPYPDEIRITKGGVASGA